MKNLRKISLIYLILTVIEVRCAIIEQINDNVTVIVNDDGTIVSLSMNENNHDFDEVNTPHVPLFKINGAGSASAADVSFLSSSFRYSIEDNIMYADQSFDYETQERLYIFNLNVDGVFPVIRLNIQNIDDEIPSLTPPQCSFDENTIYTAKNSTCTCTVSDPDGWLNKTTFEIVNNTNGEADIFALEFRDPPEDDVYSATVYVTVRQELNYQNITFYLFDIRARDGANHSTTPELVRAIVNVVDLPDTPPEWTVFFSTQEFEEKSLQNFNVRAIDGDYGINDPIFYEKLWEDDEDANYISIDGEGQITVSYIDRDKDDISTYAFEIVAYKEPKELFSTTLPITFFIVDIDDNPPSVDWILDSSFTNQTLEDVTDKTTSMSFLENEAGTLNLTIFIRDRDTGENAQFTVELENVEDNEVSYTDAFVIVPSAGYRNGLFTISVRNATYLDYEKPDWDNFSFYVITTGTLNPEFQDRLLVEISLIDYNDEYPKFLKDEYSVDINETAKRGFEIIQIMATDLDAEDKVLEHTLIGSTYVNRVLAIENETGVIYVNADNAFDYDTVNPIFVQVRATDKVGHTATVPLTINLLDINNKAPTITVAGPINVDENQNYGTVLNASITASDMDTTANLTAEIDWDASYAMKNSRRLDMDNETISQQVKFLYVDYQPLNIDDEDSEDNRDIKIFLIVNDNNPNETTPDFELFDSLYLSLKVTDWNTDPEFMDNQNTSSLILISINDINDNTPFFPEADLPENERDNRTVLEFALDGTAVGSIVAIDLDVDDTVTYDCKPLNPEFDGIEVNMLTGAFTVKNSTMIDADTDKTFTFNYTCTASDNGYTHTSDELTVHFYILDVNNKRPEVTIDPVVTVDEKSPAGTNVSEIETHDDDRDIPFHTVECTLDRTTTCADQFIIRNNIIQVRNGGDDIDRDRGDKSYTCPMTCVDNPDRLQNDQTYNFVPVTFTIALRDINDNTPIVLTTSFDTDENVAVDEIIGILIATDIDEGDNAEIDFNVTSVENEYGEQFSDLFGTTVDENYKIDDTHKQANLVALTNLRGYYGTYNVGIGVTDRGDPPLSDLYYITITVAKFNFESPIFVSPVSSSFVLLSSQQPSSQLILFRGGDTNYLPDFYASDSTESDECTKWDVVITFEQLAPAEDTIFTIARTETCTGQLQVNNLFDPESVLSKTYKLKLIATAREGEPQDGEAPYTTEKEITINFLDNNQKPTFSCPEMIFEFREEKLDQTQDLACNATYDVDDDDLVTLYYLDPESADDIVKSTFDVDVTSGAISLKQVISYKKYEQFHFRIVASNDSSPHSNNPNSYLDVTCNVIEINNNVPQWRRPVFFGAVMNGYIRNTPIVTVEATDLDKIDQGKLTYYINGSIKAVGSGLDGLPASPFLLSETTGEIRLNFQVDSTMSGYFQFDVTVWDVQDAFGNGPHSNTAPVTIFIITSDNTVNFRFYNTMSEVQEKEEEMLEVVSEVLAYDAYTQKIDKETENGVELDDTTFASLYFINSSSTLEAIQANTILRLVSNVNTFSNLARELRNRTSLVLLSFPSTNNSSQNLEEVLRAWLVGVSVVLGALCLILLVTFILKTRELNNRIKKLTTNKFGSQESGLNRLGISAPTTNKHAIEGSNPIFNIHSNDVKRDLNKFEDDAHSIRSGDSDLIGIEDNPEFDYHRDKSEYI